MAEGAKDTVASTNLWNSRKEAVASHLDSRREKVGHWGRWYMREAGKIDLDA